MPAEVIVTWDGEETTLSWPANKRLLDAMLDAGVDAPYGCTMGQCGACQCVVEGQDTNTTSHMVENNVLDDYDIRDGIRLACQTLPDSEGIYHVSYQF